jgi:hypothetical protein
VAVSAPTFDPEAAIIAIHDRNEHMKPSFSPDHIRQALKPFKDQDRIQRMK